MFKKKDLKSILSDHLAKEEALFPDKTINDESGDMCVWACEEKGQSGLGLRVRLNAL